METNFYNYGKLESQILTLVNDSIFTIESLTMCTTILWGSCCNLSINFYRKMLAIKQKLEKIFGGIKLERKTMN